MKTVRKNELAELLEKSEATLTSWQKNGMPIHKEGNRGQGHQYRVWDVVQWLINRELSKLTIDENGRVHDYEAERARLTHHQANKTELEEKVLRGQLIPSEVVSLVQSRYITAFRAKCLSIPTKVAARVLCLSSSTEVESEIRTAICEALTELAEFKLADYGIQSVQEPDSDNSTTPQFNS